MSGKAISFCLPDQGSKVREIERLTRLYLPISELPELPVSFNQPSNTSNRFNRSNHSPRRNAAPSRFGHAKRRY